MLLRARSRQTLEGAVKRSVTLGLAVMAALILGGSAVAKSPDGLCHVGVYRMADGGLLDIAPSEPGLRWRRLDGRTGKLLPTTETAWTSTSGWTGRADGADVTFGACGAGQLRVQGQAGRRLDLQVIETVFQGDGGVPLAGRLVLPQGDAAVPVSVLVHGSEATSARTFYFQQRAWPANGVGVFVYDKRGSGGSKGKYTQDFHVLARDGAAAVREARRLAGARAARVGVEGGSQGGWIGPLVAGLTPVDYVIALYGMAESPLAENRGEVIQGLIDKGYGGEALIRAGEVADATGVIMASNYKDGWPKLAELRRRYGQESWFKDLDGEFTGDILKHPPAAVRLLGPRMSQGTTWNHDPMPVLKAVSVPMLWVRALATWGRLASTVNFCLGVKAGASASKPDGPFSTA